MVVTAAATYLITTGGFGAQKYYNDKFVSAFRFFETTKI